MMDIRVLFFLVLLTDGVHMAPMIGTEIDPIQGEVDQILEEALLNNSQNLAKMEAVFAYSTEYIKVCAPFKYTIFCEDQECTSVTTAKFRCTDGYNTTTYIWTSFNPHHLAGDILLTTASFNWTVFGFEWGGACDLGESNTPVLNITVSSLAVLCDVDAEKYINQSLRRLTEKVGCLHNCPCNNWSLHLSLKINRFQH
jgi:hypothetical protein